MPRKSDGFPPMPVGPTMPTVRDVAQPKWPTLQERRQAQVENIAQSDRYITWQDGHPLGTSYDFVVFDYLQYDRHLTEADFVWQAQVGNGYPVDFYFPTRQHAWNLTSRAGFAVRPTVQHPPVTAEVAASTGLTQIDIYIEDLSKDPKAALDKAWAGVQAV